MFSSFLCIPKAIAGSESVIKFTHNKWIAINGAGSPIIINVNIANTSAILHQAQTMAFTTLAFSELFHMIGMSNVKKSFVSVFKSKNIMLLIAFVLGISLQLLVIEVPGIRDVFSTFNLNLTEWIVTAIHSILPLIAHEIVVLVLKIKAKSKKS